MEKLDFYYKHPTTIQVSGPTRCGKTRLVRHMLEKQLIQPFATRIILVYSEWQPDYKNIHHLYPPIEFQHGWRDEIFETLCPKQRNIIILDDQISSASSSKTVADLFTRGSHHRNLTVIYLVQNVYNHGKSQRTISLNSHYSVVFRNGRDAFQFRTMSYQIGPSDARWLLDAFTDATSKPYGYLVLDHHPSTPEDNTVVKNILPGEQLTYYINNHPKLTRK